MSEYAEREELEITPLENLIDGYNHQIKELKAENSKLVKEARAIRLVCGKDVAQKDKELTEAQAMCEWLADELWRWSDGEHSKEGWLTQARKEIKKK